MTFLTSFQFVIQKQGELTEIHSSYFFCNARFKRFWKYLTNKFTSCIHFLKCLFTAETNLLPWEGTAHASHLTFHNALLSLVKQKKKKYIMTISITEDALRFKPNHKPGV